MFLKVSPMKRVMRFSKKGKLAPRYIGPFEIRSRVGQVAYRFVLPPELSMFRKYIADPSHVLQPQAVEFSEVLTYEECPVAIVDRQVRQLRTKNVTMVKVLWSNHTAKDFVDD